MIPDDHFHPDHIVPAIEFIAAFVECPDFSEAHVRVELFAVPRQVLVFLDGIADAGVEIGNAPALQDALQFPVKAFAIAAPFRVARQINRQLGGMFIGFPSDKGGLLDLLTHN